ncbi:MAG: hypothetical protein R3F62_12405 [Planctomycetota bacterium]
MSIYLEDLSPADDDDLETWDVVIEALGHESSGQPLSHERLSAIFSFFEANAPEDPNDAVWAAVHLVESQAGYRACLVASLLRKPNVFSQTLLERLLWSSKDDTGEVREDLVALTRNLLRDPLIPERLGRSLRRTLDLTTR